MHMHMHTHTHIHIYIYIYTHTPTAAVLRWWWTGPQLYHAGAGPDELRMKMKAQNKRENACRGIIKKIRIPPFHVDDLFPGPVESMYLHPYYY